MGKSLIEIAKAVIQTEADSVLLLKNRIDQKFDEICHLIRSCKGKVILIGMGKSGHIARKIASTLASTGTPSFYLHPGEAGHGDLGMIESEDIVLLISNSGETDEVLKLIPFLHFQKNTTISMSGNPKSTLAKNTDFHLNVFVEKEACPLQLAPTSSTTAILVMGDALAVALMSINDFNDVNFASFHPGGNLGKRLLTIVDMVMTKHNLPICDKKSSIKDVINKITSGKCGLVIVTEKNMILGVITDGDIRRFMSIHEKDFFALRALDLMNGMPKTIGPNENIIIANDMMNKWKINSLVVIDDLERVVGILQKHDVDKNTV